MALRAFIGLCPVLDVVFYYTISLIFVVHCVVCGIEIRGLMPKTVFAGLLKLYSGQGFLKRHGGVVHDRGILTLSVYLELGG